MGNFGSGELLLIVVVGLLLFGPNKIPELARSCGRAVNQFKQGLKEGMEEEPTLKKSESVDPKA